MRKHPTPAEKAFWARVRNRQFMNLKFNRQFIVEYHDSRNKPHYYAPDFHCHELKLITELDGPIHQFQQEEDATREERLRLLGFRIIRFSNEEILQDIKGVLNKLEAAINRLR